MSGITKLNEYTSMLTFPFGELKSHLYLIHDQNEAALIDAHVASMSEEVIEKIKEVIPLSHLKTVILTHGHMDHVGVSSHLKEKTEASIAIHIADAQYVEEPWTAFTTLYDTFGITKQNYEDFQSMAGEPVKVTLPLHHGDTVKVGSVELQIHHTPGHSPGSICLYWPEKKMLFSGDLIFKEGLGRTDLPGGNGEELKASIKRLSDLDIEYILPGHGGIISGVKEVRRNFQEIENYWFAYV